MDEDGITQSELEEAAQAGVTESDEASLEDTLSASPPTVDPDQADPGPDSSLVDQVRKLREDLDTANKRTQDNQTAFRQENHQRQVVEGILAAEEAKRQREMQMAQVARMREMPSAPDLEDYDPKAMVAYTQQVAKWAAAQGQLASHGVSQALTQAMPRFESLVKMAKSNAMELAASRLGRWGFEDDFRTRMVQIEQQLSQQGDPTDLLMDPNMLLTAYQLDRNQRGLPMVAANKPKPPGVAPTTPGTDMSARAKRVNPLMASIAENLGMEAFEPTDEEFASLSPGVIR